MVKTFFYLLMLFTCPYLNYLQGQVLSSDQKKVLDATYTKEPVKIDGKLTEAQWHLSSIADSFKQIEPMQGTATKFPTIVRVLYDDKNLYVGAICNDSSGKKGVRATELKREFTNTSNYVYSFCIDEFNDKRHNMTIATNH